MKELYHEENPRKQLLKLWCVLLWRCNCRWCICLRRRCTYYISSLRQWFQRAPRSPCFRLILGLLFRVVSGSYRRSRDHASAADCRETYKPAQLNEIDVPITVRICRTNNPSQRLCVNSQSRLAALQRGL